MATSKQREVVSGNVNTQSFPTPQHHSDPTVPGTHFFQGSVSDSALVWKEHSPKQLRVSFESDPCIGSTSRGAHPSMYPPPRNCPSHLTALSCKPQGTGETPRVVLARQGAQEIHLVIIALRNRWGITTLPVHEVIHLVR